MKKAWTTEGIEVIDWLDSRLDGVLVNSSYLGPSRRLLPEQAKRLVQAGHASFLATWLGLSRWRDARPSFVHRLDGVFKLYGRATDDPADAAQFEINRHMDWTIFQSDYCRQSFAEEGLDVSRSSVVLNGVDLGRFAPADQTPASGPLRLVAVAWSSNLRKGAPAAVEASALPDVEVTFVGNWPQGLDPGKVEIIPPQPHAELARLLQEHHALLHMAQNDPCSNAVLEGMASGLPVIYHPSGGTPGIVGDCGVCCEADLRTAVQELRDRYAELRGRVLRRRSELAIEHAARAYLAVFDRLGRIAR